ncbi:hypothetical protein GY45DRAFT_1264336 [Cubamyces sp. BRFM 1775]|nr:hypothetical protein GY45DRAFT_1264336 [Cubamyces sp. BRFM 1775]
MGRESPKDPIRIDKLPDAIEVEEYELANGPCCTVANFKPDLMSTPNTPWNKSVIQVFVDHFLSTNRYPGATRDHVGELFTGHLKYLGNKFRLSKKGKEVQKQRQKLLNRSERQRNLFHRRLTVAMMFPALRRHVPMLQALGPFGMSSDESSHINGFPCYRVLKKSWRDPEITPWLRLFDSMYRRLRLNDVDQNTPGSHPHMRMQSDKVSNRRSPVKGLPRNAYDKTWYNGLCDYDRQLLNAKPTTYDFTHSDELVRYGYVL